LQQQREVDAVAQEALLQQAVNPPHGAQRGAQDEGAAAGRHDGGISRFRHGFRIVHAVRIGHAARRIQQGIRRIVERAAPDRGIGLGQAKLAAVVGKILADGERRRGENPGAQ